MFKDQPQTAMSDSTMDIDVVIRPNSIWLHGVDDLSTDDVKVYIKKYTDEFFKIEWINDTSLNVVFEQDNHATETLGKISINEVPESQEERLIHPIVQTRKEMVFTARISNSDDKKVKNAGQYSRYYLFNPKEERSLHTRDRENYREREIIRRRKNGEDEDLFPTKAAQPSNSNPSDPEAMLPPKTSDSNTSLIGRIGVKLSDKIEEKALDDDDLFKK